MDGVHLTFRPIGCTGNSIWRYQCHIIVCAENIFDKYPARSQYQAFRGLIYSRNSPYSTDGGYYYARLDLQF